MIDLNTVWFLLIAVLIGGYAILDGFDLGVGVMHLFAKDENERRLHMNAIGPVWDGNEVWLLTGGGALFAAFPVVYATVFSGFYIALMLVLFALIFRAVSFEFRGKVDSPKWKRMWDWLFGIGSLIPAIVFGVAIGNILRGVSVNGNGYYLGNFFDLLNPYAILIGLLSLSMFVMHGAIYMILKTEGELHDRMVKWANGAWMIFVLFYLLSTIYSFFEAAYLFQNVFSNFLFWLFLVFMLLSLVSLPVLIKGKNPFRAFLTSSLLILSMIGLMAVSLFPRLVPSNIDLAYSLTIYNASSSQLTLTTMLIIALIGMPIVIGYTIYIYRVFKGKVKLEENSY